jgi:Family of unknown function (DUF5695)
MYRARVGLALWCLIGSSEAQGDTLGLGDGSLNLSIGNFDLEIVKGTQVLASLRPSGSSFDFSPLDCLPYRADNGNYHVGDILITWRSGSED